MTEEKKVTNYVNWAISTQSSVADAENALSEAFEGTYADADDGTKAQFKAAKDAVDAFLKKEDAGDWFQFNLSGSHPQNEGDRPHISIGVTPVAKPYGVQ